MHPGRRAPGRPRRSSRTGSTAPVPVVPTVAQTSTGRSPAATSAASAAASAAGRHVEPAGGRVDDVQRPRAEPGHPRRLGHRRVRLGGDVDPLPAVDAGLPPGPARAAVQRGEQRDQRGRRRRVLDAAAPAAGEGERRARARARRPARPAAPAPPRWPPARSTRACPARRARRRACRRAASAARRWPGSSRRSPGCCQCVLAGTHDPVELGEQRGHRLRGLSGSAAGQLRRAPSPGLDGGAHRPVGQPGAVVGDPVHHRVRRAGGTPRGRDRSSGCPPGRSSGW